MTSSPGLFQVIRNEMCSKHYSIRTGKRLFTGLDHTFSFTHYNIREC